MEVNIARAPRDVPLADSHLNLHLHLDITVHRESRQVRLRPGEGGNAQGKRRDPAR